MFIDLISKTKLKQIWSETGNTWVSKSYAIILILPFVSNVENKIKSYFLKLLTKDSTLKPFYVFICRRSIDMNIQCTMINFGITLNFSI